MADAASGTGNPRTRYRPKPPPTFTPSDTINARETHPSKQRTTWTCNLEISWQIYIGSSSFDLWNFAYALSQIRSSNETLDVNIPLPVISWNLQYQAKDSFHSMVTPGGNLLLHTSGCFIPQFWDRASRRRVERTWPCRNTGILMSTWAEWYIVGHIQRRVPRVIAIYCLPETMVCNTLSFC